MVNREEVLALLASQPHSSNDTFFSSQPILDELEFKRSQIEVDLIEKRKIIEMRGYWSKWILRAILGIISFDFIIVFLTGIGFLKFQSAEWIIPTFIGDSLIKTIGLALIIVNFLFDRDKKKA